MSVTAEHMLSLLRQYRMPLFIGCVGLLILLSACGVAIILSRPTEPIRFSSDTASNASESAVTREQIRVDVEGAVAHPGLVNLPYGSRVEDALVAAGGLTARADMDWIAKNLNRATILVDGAKLYIWSVDETTHSSSANTNAQQSQTGSVEGAVSHLININSASLSELDTLSGVGPVTAQKIVDNRPYQTLEELVTKKAMSASVFGKIKEKITL